MRKILFSLILLSFLSFGLMVLAQDSDLPDPGLTPDSPFYFLKSWKEKIQTFFTFGEENKAKQFLHLSEVRLAEYQRMVEKGKTEIAQKTLEKYEKQLSHALEKAREAKEKGRDVDRLTTLISEKTLRHREVLLEVYEKVPEQPKSGIERAIEVSQKGFEKAIEAVSGEKKEELEEKLRKAEERIKELEEKEEVAPAVPAAPVEPAVPKEKQAAEQQKCSEGAFITEEGIVTIHCSAAKPSIFLRKDIEDIGQYVTWEQINAILSKFGITAQQKCSESTFTIEGGVVAIQCSVPKPPIFSRKDMERYATWEQINAILSRFGITAVLFDEYWQPMAPSEAQREMMRESLTYFTYVLDSVFQGTRINEFLKGLKQIAIHYTDFKYSFIGGFPWQYRPSNNDITMPPRTPLDLQNPAYAKDQYTSKIIHEIAHAIDNSLSESGIMENFRKICWEGSKIKTSCYEREKSFVPLEMTTEKNLTSFRHPALGPEYYSAKDFREDFAESVVAYIVSPNEFRDLAQKYPILSQKYEFIKTNVFSGKEFQEYEVK